MEKDFDIRHYVWNIYEISDFYKLKNMTVALDMFVTNIELGCDRYSGASEIDYIKLRRQWNRTSKQYRSYERIVFDTIIQISYSKLCRAWVKKDKHGFINICNSIGIMDIVNKRCK